MAIPRQVVKQLAEVEALEKQLLGQNEEPVEEPVEEPTEGQEPEAKAEPDDSNDGTAEPQEPKVEEPKKADDDAAVWKQKYKTLQGMYDKEVPQLHSEVKTLTKELETLKKSLETKKEEAKQLKKLVTDEDVQNFGEDLIEVQRKVAREVAAEFEEKLEALKSENTELRQLLGTTDSKVSETSFEARLHRLVPDFQQLDSDPRWIAWLDEVDPVLRGPRRTIALQAYQSGDAEAVAYYVDLFRKTIEPAPEPAKEAPQTKELERQIQPTRNASNATPTSQKGKTYTTADIQRMFQKAAKLGSSGRVEEAKKLEAEIDAAYMQRRVVA
jgi:uncharacterized protein YukE